jgi:hypothetical protein
MLALLLVLAHQPQINATIEVAETKVIRSFEPNRVFGGAIDGHDKSDETETFSKESEREMLKAGLGPLSYRLRTELGCEAWHWNPEGTWSDPANHQGYWTSSSVAGKPILKSYGYRLPRRGDTIDQANNDSYSRLDDGDESSYWKTNPYLDPAYGSEAYSERPQWILIDLKARQPINAVQIDWAQPYAKHYEIQHWEGNDDPDEAEGEWKTFTGGDVNGHGGKELLNLGDCQTRFIKILLTESSKTGIPGSKDPRDRLGFAIREIRAGRQSGATPLQDVMKHGLDKESQTVIYVSSTDPWHREQDKDEKVEQPGFDLFFKSALTRDLPVLMSFSCLYDTPDNIVAEGKWLHQRGYKLRGLELGEEPDGQCASAEDYGSLYIQSASRLKSIFPNVPIGGPSFQNASEEYREFPDPGDDWLERLVNYLHERKGSNLFQFCTFEWYPFDDVAIDPSLTIRVGAEKLDDAVKRLNEAGMKGLPWMITEYGYSAFAGEPEVTLPGAVFDLDCALDSVRLGTAVAYLYGYEPATPIEEQEGQWGDNMILESVPNGLARLPCFYAAQLLTSQVCETAGIHQMVQCKSDQKSVGCYALKRPDHRLALVLLNRTPNKAVVKLHVNHKLWDRWTYSPAQYQWKADGEKGRPSLSLPPVKGRLSESQVALDGYSITVLVSR